MQVQFQLVYVHVFSVQLGKSIPRMVNIPVLYEKQHIDITASVQKDIQKGLT